MLRALFGEPPYEWDGPLRDTIEAMEKFALLMQSRGHGDSIEAARHRKYQIWTEGLLRSLDELEESRYAAVRFANRLTKAQMSDMSPEERMNYYSHIYYDKNAYIRVFSLLDKLGTLMNEFLKLETEKRMKARFSYFTVLRNMRSNGLHPDLSRQLDRLKETHGEAMGRLRRRRNMEIHQMNAELQDDLMEVLNVKQEPPYLDNIRDNMNDLDEGWEMVYLTLTFTFQHMSQIRRKQS